MFMSFDAVQSTWGLMTLVVYILQVFLRMCVY